MSDPAGRILLVDDEPALIAVLQPALHAAGYIVSIGRAGGAASTAAICGWSSKVTDQYLRIYIGFLRQKLEADASRPVHVITEPGIGYRLAAPNGEEVQVKFHDNPTHQSGRIAKS